MGAQDVIIPIIILIAVVSMVVLLSTSFGSKTPVPTPAPPVPTPAPAPPVPTPAPAPPVPTPTPEPPVPTPTPEPPVPTPTPEPPVPTPTPEPPVPTPAPAPQPSDIDKFAPGVPASVVKTRAFYPNSDKYTKDCLGARGVINVDSKGTMVCNKYITGETISAPQSLSINHPLNTTIDMTSYLKAVYPAYPATFDPAFKPFYDNLEFLYTPEFKRVKPITNVQFRNTEFVEVHPLNVLFSKLNRDTWYGTWYRMGTGSGWFIRNNTCLMCYNILHAFNLFDLPDNVVKNVLGSKMPTNRNDGNNVGQKNELFNDASRRLLSQIALQRGYKCIQISNEWTGAAYERFFIDLVEQIYSIANLVQKNPFEIQTNPYDESLWLNAFLKPGVPQIADGDILDTIPRKTLGERYGDFAFKTGCQKQGGTLSIGDMLLNCEKIVRFGAPAVRLDSEMSKIDFSKWPQSSELEKLQSYFSIVYGSPEVWRSKDLATLQDYWKRMEMRYKLSIKPTTPYNKYKSLSFGVAAPGMEAYQEDGRLAEAVKYVEVVRQNVKNSYYDTSQYFSGCYYYPCRGSGLFIPVGRLFIAKTKQVSAAIWGQPIAYCCNPEDVDIAKMASYKGYQTLMLVRYSGFTSPEAVELVDLRDPITSQMSLIRTTPFDPKINEKMPYKLDDIWGNKPQVDVSVCITDKQYEPGKQLNKCPAWSGIR
jgi:hypothetical protein